MAIDTATEKLALMEWGQVWEPGLPLSPSALGQDDQQQLLWGYPGILWGAAAAGYAFTGDLTTVFRQYLDALHDTAVAASDTNMLVEADVDTMVAGTIERDDRNTQYNEYLH